MSNNTRMPDEFQIGGSFQASKRIRVDVIDAGIRLSDDDGSSLVIEYDELCRVGAGMAATHAIHEQILGLRKLLDSLREALRDKTQSEDGDGEEENDGSEGQALIYARMPAPPPGLFSILNEISEKSIQ